MVYDGRFAGDFFTNLSPSEVLAAVIEHSEAQAGR